MSGGTLIALYGVMKCKCCGQGLGKVTIFGVSMTLSVWHGELCASCADWYDLCMSKLILAKMN